MQVNFLDSLPNPAGDSSTARSAERNDHQSEGLFYMQMDHACNLANEKSDIPAEEKPAKRISANSGKEGRNRLSVESPSDSNSLHTEDIRDSNCARRDRAYNHANENSDIPPEEKPVKQIATHSVEEKRKRLFVESRSDVKSLPTAAIPALNPTSSDPKMQEKENFEVGYAPTEKKVKTILEPSTPLETFASAANVMKQTRSESTDGIKIQTALIPKTDDPIQVDFEVKVEPETPGATISASGKKVVAIADPQNADDVSGTVRRAIPAAESVLSGDLRGWAIKLDSSHTVSYAGSELGALKDSTPFPPIRQQTQPESQAFQSDIEVPVDFNLKGRNADKTVSGKTEEMIPAVLKHANAVDPVRSQLSSGKESASWRTQEGILEKSQIDTGGSQTILSQPRQGLPLQSALSSTPGNPGSAGDSLRAQDSDGESAGPQAVAAKKLEAMASAAFESADAGDSTSDQNSRSAGSNAWAAFQGKYDGTQPIAGRIQPSYADRQFETPGALSAGTGRTPDGGMSQLSGTGQHSTAQPKEFLFQLAEQIQVQLRNGKGEIRIQLKPENLGRLEIRAESTSAGVVARIAAESSHVKTYLENNLPFLQQALQSQGFRIDRIHVVIQEGFDFQSSSGFTAQFGHAGSGQSGDGTPGFTKTSTFPASNQTEELTVDPATWIALNPNVSFHTIA
jgi:flagellar hook-length control protein FliK